MGVFFFWSGFLTGNKTRENWGRNNGLLMLEKDGFVVERTYLSREGVEVGLFFSERRDDEIVCMLFNLP